jgi:hypothetical protein
VVPRAVAVLCAADDARAVGVAAAGLLARRAGAGCGLALVWCDAAASPQSHPARGVSSAQPVARSPQTAPFASRAARRLAAALAARDVTAAACGRAVHVALPADADEALAVARRAAAAAGDAPGVLVRGGPRPDAFDAVLAEQDRVLVLTRPGTDAAVGGLAVAGLPADARAHAIALRPAGRALAAAGLAVPAALRRALVADGERP